MSNYPGNGMLAAAVAALLVSGCVVKPVPPTSSSSVLKSASIGPAGGTLAVSASDGSTLAGTSITIPAGALTQSVVITISSSEQAVNQGGDLAAGPVADFGPEGTTFTVSATITLPVKIPSGSSAADLWIEAVEANGAARAIAVESQAGGFATFQTSSFTRFGGVIREIQSPDSGVVCNCPAIPADGCTVAGSPPCLCPTSVPCDGGQASCLTNADCATGSYCAADGCATSGACTVKPEVCPDNCASPELCGCDGRQYCNSCIAESAGTNVAPSDTTCEADGGPAPTDGGSLAWYDTCGYPVCGEPMDAGPSTGVDAGPCPPIGSNCSNPGATCGTPTQANCGVVEVCSDHNPITGGCPISSRSFKSDIEYLDASGLERLHDQVLNTKLARYHYKASYGDPDPSHVGFIIEDQLTSPAVDRARSGVDVYAYLSMVVATMQVQEREIRDLRNELDAARQNVCEAPAEK